MTIIGAWLASRHKKNSVHHARSNPVIEDFDKSVDGLAFPDHRLSARQCSLFRSAEAGEVERDHGIRVSVPNEPTDLGGMSALPISLAA